VVKLESNGIVVEAETVRKAEAILKRKIAERNEGENRATDLAYSRLGRMVGRRHYPNMYLMSEPDQTDYWKSYFTQQLAPYWGSSIPRHELNVHGFSKDNPWQGPNAQGLVVQDLVAILSNGLGELSALRVGPEAPSGAQWVAVASHGDIPTKAQLANGIEPMWYLGQVWVDVADIPSLEDWYQTRKQQLAEAAA
jgi:hypothetical protein